MEEAFTSPSAETGAAQTMGKVLSQEPTVQTAIEFPRDEEVYIIHGADPYLSQDCVHSLPEAHVTWLLRRANTQSELDDLQQAVRDGTVEQPPALGTECFEMALDLVVDALEHDSPRRQRISPNTLADFLQRERSEAFVTVLAMRAILLRRASTAPLRIGSGGGPRRASQ